jgi:hypothetical protein
MNMIRTFPRAVVPPGLRVAARLQANALRTHRIGWWLRWNAMLTDAWIRDRLNRRRYAALSDAQARARRRSHTVFIFGSGYSLHDVTSAEWKHFAEHDVFGFNQFFFQRWVRTDFHLMKGGLYAELQWRPYASQVESLLRDHSQFADTVFVMQEGYFAQFPNQLVGYRLLPRGASALRYRVNRIDGPPTRSLAEGLRHQGGTLVDAVNCAFVLGWTHIVLVGVDLYDSRYFYLPPDQTVGVDHETQRLTGTEHNQVRGQRFDQPHNTLRLGLVGIMEDWHRVLAQAGVRLSLYNPRSLLSEVLPLYDRSDVPGVAAGGETRERTYA